MDFALPELGEGVYEAELVRWLVNPGDTVKRGQPLLEVMTDKATMEVPAPFAGKVTAINGEPGGKLKVGQTVLAYQQGGKTESTVVVAEKPVATAAPVAAPIMANGSSGGGVAVAAAPSVRHLARKLGIDLARSSRDRAGWAHSARRSGAALDAGECTGQTLVGAAGRVRATGYADQIPGCSP